MIEFKRENPGKIDPFGGFKREIPMVVDVDNKQLVEYIQEVRNYIVAMNVTLDTLG